MPKRSEIVKLLADVASQGTYNGITPAGARKMNKVFELVAQLINELEAEERRDAYDVGEVNDKSV